MDFEHEGSVVNVAIRISIIIEGTVILESRVYCMALALIETLHPAVEPFSGNLSLARTLITSSSQFFFSHQLMAFLSWP